MYLRCYQALGYIMPPFLHALYSYRVSKGKEDSSRRNERFGYASQTRPQGPLVWVHAASVGETNAVLPLLHRLGEMGYGVLLTTGTLTSSRVAEQRAPEHVIHQFVPYDTPAALDRFLNYWQPQCAITVESEIWPLTFTKLRQRKIPLVIVNARMSARSCDNWLKLPSLTRDIFQSVTLVLAQTNEDAARFAQLGAKRTKTIGNLKYHSNELHMDTGSLAQLEAQIGNRPLWLAASTHPKEEQEIINAHQKIRAVYPDILTIIVPRHPERGQMLFNEFKQQLPCARRAQGDKITATTQVYFADTLGELGVFFCLSKMVFMGGSLVEIGGHNPMEPAQMGCAVITGPHIENFAQVYEDFAQNAAVTKVQNSDQLASSVMRFLQHPEQIQEQSNNAKAVVTQGRGGLQQVVLELENLLGFVRAKGEADVQKSP
ncbi:3-deoxy-D-manno-octulosonic acid transferase [Polycladidibacter stylochi]|uniref:3-deoxy-D-manno-octulosonic acid transferase n=1 Tax=Polycladidibacter stylochi TaxID=1807766 RepID=UPI000A4B87A8|nr:3-deoxy-D-manno-octulosonic acid transferase [Pseudovibrio stylochi]